jgi:hypothetical protein
MKLFKDRDFTPLMYRRLLEALRTRGYRFQTFEEYCSDPGQRVVILRHDVDRKSRNALMTAEIESGLGIRASYHFRLAGSSNVPEMITRIAESGHEIAYHYEDLATAVKRYGKHGIKTLEYLSDEAVKSFRSGLEYFRQYYPVRVISMHGSPANRLDNRMLWKYHDYRESGIICEPYFDIDHSDMLYLTDTGRRWDGDRFNIRDRAADRGRTITSEGYGGWKRRPAYGSLMDPTPAVAELRSRYKVHSTSEIISLAVAGSLPAKMIFNTHPERWHSSLIPWIIELFEQHIRNFIKMLVIRYRYR